MTTYRAVVKYPIEATDPQKIEALRQGLSDCAIELVDLGAKERIDDFLEDARQAAEDEAQANEDYPD